PPASAERRGRDVEGAAGGGRQGPAVRDELDDLVADGDGPGAGALVDPAHVARVAEDREQRLEAVGVLERLARGRGVGGALAGQRDLEPARHGPSMDADPVSRARVVALTPRNRQEVATCQPVGRVRRGDVGTSRQGMSSGGQTRSPYGGSTLLVNC